MPTTHRRGAARVAQGPWGRAVGSTCDRAKGEIVVAGGAVRAT